MKNCIAVLSVLIAVTLSGVAYAEGAEWIKYGAEQAKKDAEVGYRVATIEGDDICKPPKDYNAAGYARPIDLLGTFHEPTGYEAENMKQWFCSYQKPDGTIVQYGSSFTPLEDWRNLNSRTTDDQ